MLAMLTQLSVVAPVCAGTRNLLIVMNMHLQRIKEFIAEILTGKVKDRGVLPLIPTYSQVMFTTDPNKNWECCNILCMVSIQMVTWIKVCYMYIYCLALIICVNVFLDVQDKLRIISCSHFTNPSSTQSVPTIQTKQY